MDLKTLTSAVLEIAEERGIDQKKIIEVIEEAIASAYKRKRIKIIDCTISPYDIDGVVIGQTWGWNNLLASTKNNQENS